MAECVVWCVGDNWWLVLTVTMCPGLQTSVNCSLSARTLYQPRTGRGLPNTIRLVSNKSNQTSSLLPTSLNQFYTMSSTHSNVLGLYSSSVPILRAEALLTSLSGHLSN